MTEFAGQQPKFPAAEPSMSHEAGFFQTQRRLSMFDRELTTAQLAREADVPDGTIRTWLHKGYLRPKNMQPGTGYLRAFSEDDVQKARALKRITATFGDGVLARQVIDTVVPQVHRGT